MLLKNLLSLSMVYLSFASSTDRSSTFLDLSYTQGEKDHAHLFDLYLPAKSKLKPPLLIFIHGGAWVSGDKSQISFIGQTLVKEGIAVALINYRLSNSGVNPHPAHTQDAGAAVRWLLSQSEKYGFDPKRVFVGGHSAGAHISALLDLDSEFLKSDQKKIKGFIGIDGIYDIPKIVQDFPQYKTEFIQTAFGTQSKKWEEASPQLKKISNHAPWLIIHSTGDEMVNMVQAKEFVDTLRLNGVNVEFSDPKTLSHNAVITKIPEAGNPITEAILNFMRRI